MNDALQKQILPITCLKCDFSIPVGSVLAVEIKKKLVNNDISDDINTIS